MKTISVLAAIIFFLSEVFGRKIHKNKFCDYGSKNVFEKCTWKPCGSECMEGLNCDNGKCLVKYGNECQESTQCVSYHYCKDRVCRFNPDASPGK